jgi:hypothetical protein
LRVVLKHADKESDPAEPMILASIIARFKARFYRKAALSIFEILKKTAPERMVNSYQTKGTAIGSSKERAARK